MARRRRRRRRGRTDYPKTSKQPRPEPNETTELWREFRQVKQEEARERLAERTEEISALVDIGYGVRSLTEYQFRVNERLDLYPARRRWHDIKTQHRGGYRKAIDPCWRILGPPQIIRGVDMGNGQSISAWTVRCSVCERVIYSGNGEPPKNLVIGDSSTDVGRAIETHMREGAEAGKHQHDFQTVVKMAVQEN